MSKILLGIIFAMGLVGGLYYYTTDATITELRKLLAAYELKFATQEETIQALEKDFALQTEALKDMQVQSQQIQQDMNRYLDIFKRHNLTKLAAAKPGLVEGKVNKATKGVFDGIEDDSASLDRLDDGVQLSNASPEGSGDSN